MTISEPIFTAVVSVLVTLLLIVVNSVRGRLNALEAGLNSKPSKDMCDEKHRTIQHAMLTNDERFLRLEQKIEDILTVTARIEHAIEQGTMTCFNKKQ